MIQFLHVHHSPQGSEFTPVLYSGKDLVLLTLDFFFEP